LKKYILKNEIMKHGDVKMKLKRRKIVVSLTESTFEQLDQMKNASGASWSSISELAIKNAAQDQTFRKIFLGEKKN